MARRRYALAIAVLAIGCSDKPKSAPVATAAPAKPSAVAPSSVKVSGTVIDRTTGKPVVADVQIIFAGARADITTYARKDGTYEVSVAPGSYRVYVKSNRVMTANMSERNRLDNPPHKELAGALDEALIPVLDVDHELGNIDIPVVPTSQLGGIATDKTGHPIAGAIVRLRALHIDDVRPALGTDIAITDSSGFFSLQAPANPYLFEATHAAFAGILDEEAVRLDPGDSDTHNIVLERGCIISGRVVSSDGSPAPDGAIERLGGFDGSGDHFGPSGRIDAGTFSWVTTIGGSVTLRAWPWRSPPSLEKTFACRDGKQFKDVVLRLPDQEPDLSGEIVDANNRPVPMIFLDVHAIDPIVTDQQERADAAGSWHVYKMPPARYRITGTAPGLGIVDQIVVAPKQDIRLVLSGTGRIVGTASEVTSGSVEVSFMRCAGDDDVDIAHEPRIVPVVGGRFVIEHAPACTLTMVVGWREQRVETKVIVEPDRTAYIEVTLGAPREKTVTGIVRDVVGNTVEGARVTAILNEREAETVRTDANGRYTIKTHSGAQLVAGKAEHTGRAQVGRANVASEQIDLTLDDAN